MFDIYPGEDSLFPELRLFEDKQSRTEALRNAHRASVRGWRRRLLLAFGAVCGGVFGACVLPRLQSGLNLLAPEAYKIGGIRLIVKILIGTLFLLAMAYIPMLPLTRNNVRRALRQQLNDLGIAVCMACCYQLKGINSGRCPECGKPFDGKEP